MTKKLKGITLTETLVYIAIFSVFMLTLIQFFLSVQINQNKVHKELELQMSKIFITNHLHENIEFNFFLDNENSNLETTVFKNSTQTMAYKIVNDKLILEENGIEKQITNRKVLVESFSINNIFDNGNNTIAVRINITLRHRDDSRIKENFSTLIKLIEHGN